MEYFKYRVQDKNSKLFWNNSLHNPKFVDLDDSHSWKSEKSTRNRIKMLVRKNPEHFDLEIVEFKVNEKQTDIKNYLVDERDLILKKVHAKTNPVKKELNWKYDNYGSVSTEYRAIEQIVNKRDFKDFKFMIIININFFSHQRRNLKKEIKRILPTDSKFIDYPFSVILKSKSDAVMVKSILSDEKFSDINLNLVDLEETFDI